MLLQRRRWFNNIDSTLVYVSCFLAYKVGTLPSSPISRVKFRVAEGKLFLTLDQFREQWPALKQHWLVIAGLLLIFQKMPRIKEALVQTSDSGFQAY